MVHVEITDERHWFYHFVYVIAVIFQVKTHTGKSEMMYIFFRNLHKEKPGELSGHFRKIFPGRYPESTEGIELRNKIEERHDAALKEAICIFSEDDWVTIIADMISNFSQTNEISGKKEIIHNVIIPLCSGGKDLDDFKIKILNKLVDRLNIFSESLRKEFLTEAGF